jgi:MFS transporter, putative metabolite:H+ symporter
MAEIWPARLRASGMGVAYGAGNLGKFICPAELALIAGSSNFVSPQATIDVLVPAMNCFTSPPDILALVAVLFIGIDFPFSDAAPGPCCAFSGSASSIQAGA